MKRFLLGLGVLLALIVGCLAIMAAQYVPKAPPGVRVGEIAVAGLTKDQVAFRIRQWWESAKQEPVQMALPGTTDTFTATPSQLGIVLDDRASAESVAYDSFFENLKRSITSERSNLSLEPKFKTGSAGLDELEAFVAQRVPERKAARVTFHDGVWNRSPEVAGFRLDRSKVTQAALQAFTHQETVPIPIVADAKAVPDDQLNAIAEIVSEFTTRFSEGKATRSHNIRAAASRIDGVVLAPGEKFSFNKVVGRRTIKSGFKIAGVYKDGKHDVDVGGGICQVSTTLYNAALFANLKIGRRSNHSMPVPYVPLGRDATVDYGSADLVLENTYEFPIAISTTVGRGSITFRVLGQKQPDLSVKIVSGAAKSWDVGIKQQPDPSLPAGKTKVIEKGSRGHSISTYRVVYRNGVEQKREPLGLSFYRGGKRIVAVGTAGGSVESDPSPTPPDLGDGGDGG